MEYCNSCSFPIGEQETKRVCDTCQKVTHSFCTIQREDKRLCDPCFSLAEEDGKITKYELPDKIRRTYIEVYRKCPNKFRLEVLEGNVQPDNPYTRVGSDLHELFEKAIVDRTFAEEQFRAEYEKMIAKQVKEGLYQSNDEKNKFDLRADTSIRNFYELLPTLDPVFTTEETIQYSLGDDIPDVEFTMDLVTENRQGNLDLHDWKTGKTMVGKKISSDLQAPLYIYGVQKHFGRIVDNFTFYYLNEGKTRTFSRVNDNIYECKVVKRSYYINLEDFVKEIRNIFGQMKKGNFNIPRDTSSMYFDCKMCHIKEMGLCAGADQESWNQLARL